MTRTLNHNITMVGVLIIIAMLAIQTCTHKAEQNSVLTQTVTAKSDTIQHQQQQKDSVAKQASFLADVATTVAKTNEVLKDSLSSVQTDNKTLVANAVQDAIPQRDWQAEATRLQAVNDALVHENDSLLSSNYQYRNKYISIAKKKKDSTSTDSIYYSYNISLHTTPVMEPAKFLGMKLGTKAIILETRSSDSNALFDGKDSVYRYTQIVQPAGAVLSWTVNFNARAGILQTGPGLRLYWRDWNAYLATYYSFYTNHINPTISISRTLKRF